MNRVTIIYKPVAECLERCREVVSLFRAVGEFDIKMYSVDDVIVEEERAPDLIVSIGGDGTLLKISRVYQRYAPLILPLPCGRRTVLYEDIDRSKYREAINRVITGMYSVEILRRLRASANGQAYVVLNEVLLLSSDRGRVTGFEISIRTVDRKSSVKFDGDGVLIGPASGSAAYNLSARGPLVDHMVDAIFVTPLNPIELNIAPIVVPHLSKVVVSSRGYTELYADGEKKAFLEPHTPVLVEPSIYSLRVIRLYNRDPMRNVFGRRRLSLEQ